MIRRAKGVVVYLMLSLAYWFYARPYLRSARNPGRAQSELLQEIVSQNAESEFGRMHRFAEIRSSAEFRRKVPIMRDVDLATWVSPEGGERTGAGQLTLEQPEIYARTSGTTGAAKDIPMTRTGLHTMKRQQVACVAFQHRTCPAAFRGRIMALTSPAKEGVASDGKVFGAVSGHVLKDTPRLLQERYVLPPDVLSLNDDFLKYLLVLRLSIAIEDITYLGTANPSTLLRLLEILRIHGDQLLEDLERGGFYRSGDLPASLREQLVGKLDADPVRAGKLRSLCRKSEGLDFNNLWPSLRLVVTWQCAGGGIAAKTLKKYLPLNARLLELGYIASEFRGTLTVDFDRGLPTLRDNYFEFVEKEAWTLGERQTAELSELEAGKEYFIIVTTRSGLYRYFMNDIVRVTGYINSTPCLEFVQKGRGVTNITGEKLYEGQVLAALKSLTDEFGLLLTYATLVASPETASYTLFIESENLSQIGVEADEIAKRYDSLLSDHNIEYQSKRKSGRLHPVRFRELKRGAALDIRNAYLNLGQREAQIKLPALSLNNELPINFEFLT